MKQNDYLKFEADGFCVRIRKASAPEEEYDWVRRIPKAMNLVILYSATRENRTGLARAAAEELLGWNVTQSKIDFYFGRMFGRYGMSYLEPVYRNLSKEDFRSMVLMELYEKLPCLDLSKYSGSFYDMASLQRHYEVFLSFTIKECYINVLVEAAKETFPNMTREYLKSYSRLRKLSEYEVDLDWETGKIIQFFAEQECKYPSLLSEKHIDNMKMAFAKEKLHESLPSQTGLLEEHIQKEELEKAFAALDRGRQKIIRARFLHGKSVKEIAEHFNMNKTMVYYYIKDSLKILRTAIAA